ncbi:MAG: acyltransferase family protein [Burkholderiaceae bacterium]
MPESIIKPAQYSSWSDILNWLTQRFELSRGGGAQNVRPMEGLRGFAVSLVFLVHYMTLAAPWFTEHSSVLRVAGALHDIGNAGVDLFFVLSGYLIYGSLISRPQEFGKFISRRIKRIYPAFIAVFLLYVALSFVFPVESKIPKPLAAGTIYLIENLLLLPGLLPVEPINTVAWSLSYEMFYYLVIPLVISIMHLRQRSLMRRVSFFLSVTIAAIIYCSIYGGHVRLIMFISGILLYEAINSNRMPILSNSFALFTLVAGLLAALLPIAGPAGYALKITILFASFFVLCFSCFTCPNGWLAHAFSQTPLRWLGNMSYSYYLLHGLTLKACSLVLSTLLPYANYNPWWFWTMLPTMFIMTLIPTTILFLLVERPLSLASNDSKRKSINDLASATSMKRDRP